MTLFTQFFIIFLICYRLLSFDSLVGYSPDIILIGFLVGLFCLFVFAIMANDGCNVGLFYLPRKNGEIRFDCWANVNVDKDFFKNLLKSYGK